MKQNDSLCASSMSCGVQIFLLCLALEMQSVVMNQTKQLGKFLFPEVSPGKRERERERERERSSGKDVVE